MSGRPSRSKSVLDLQAVTARIIVKVKDLTIDNVHYL